MWAYVHRDPMGSWQMARQCHTQMPTSYLWHLCQDKTHEAGIESSSWKNKFWGETQKEERHSLTLQRYSVSNQQNFVSSVLSCLSQQHTANSYFLCWGMCYPVHADGFATKHQEKNYKALNYIKENFWLKIKTVVLKDHTNVFATFSFLITNHVYSTHLFGLFLHIML